MGSDWEYYFNLSGQDFPLKNQEEIRHFLSQRKGSNFFELYDCLKERRSYLVRFERYYLHTPFRVIRVPKLRRRLRPWIRPYHGECWFAAHRAFCEYATSGETRRLRRFFKWTFIPDESFFHTALMGGRFHETAVSDSLRFIEWMEGAAHPTTLTSAHLPALLQSNALFARKFEPGDPVLDRLETQIGLSAQPT